MNKSFQGLASLRAIALQAGAVLLLSASAVLVSPAWGFNRAVMENLTATNQAIRVNTGSSVATSSVVVQNLYDLQLSPGQCVQTNAADLLSTTGFPCVLPGSALFINNTATLQAGATFYVSSGTAVNFSATTLVAGTLTAGSIFDTGLAPNQCVQTNGLSQFATTGLPCGSGGGGGGGGASFLKVVVNGVVVSTPTSDLAFSSAFTGSLTSLTTASLDLNYSSATAQGNTFNGNNQLVKTSALGVLPLSVLSNVIQNTSSLQTGATFYVSSGTVVTFNAGNTTLSSGSNPQLVLNNPNFAGLFYDSLGLSFGASAPISFWSFSNSGQLCSDFSTTCSVNAMLYGPSVAGGIAGFDVNGKLTAGGSFSLSTATIRGNMLIGNDYPSITNAPLNGLRMEGSLVVDSSATISGAGGLVVTSTITAGAETINDTGAGSIQFLENVDSTTFSPTALRDNLWASISSHTLVFNPNITSTYTVVGSSTVPVLGHVAIWSSQWGLIDGGSDLSILPNPTNAVLYNNGGSVGTSANFQFNGTSVTVKSSATFTSVGGQNPVNPGFVDVYDGKAATLYLGKPLFTVGSLNQADQFGVQDQTRIEMGAYGSKSGHLDVGELSSVANHRIQDDNAGTQFIDWWNAGEMDFQTATNANGGKNIVFKPNSVSEVVISSFGVTISTAVTITSSATVTGLTSTAHLNCRGGVPSLSSCGASPSVTGTDCAGKITEGTGSPTGCVVTFNAVYGVTPFCLVQTTSTVTTAAVTSTSGSQFTITTSASIPSDTIIYNCQGGD